MRKRLELKTCPLGDDHSLLRIVRRDEQIDVRRRPGGAMDRDREASDQRILDAATFERGGHLEQRIEQVGRHQGRIAARGSRRRNAPTFGGPLEAAHEDAVAALFVASRVTSWRRRAEALLRILPRVPTQVQDEAAERVVHGVDGLGLQLFVEPEPHAHQ